MNDIFTETNTAGMWAHRYAKFLRHQKYAQNLADSSKSARVNLAHIDRLRLEKLLEYHSIVSMLACCNTDTMGRESFTDGCMSENIIRCRRLLDEPVENGQGTVVLKVEAKHTKA